VALKERDLIINLLLRGGKRISILCYGGQGGGKKHRAGLLDLGYMLKMELAQSKRNTSSGTNHLVTAREWSPVWIHQKLRHNHRAYYLLIIYLDLAKRLSVEENLNDPNADDDQEQVGIFTVLSNALFQLERVCSNMEAELLAEKHLLFFLVKLIHYTGIYPDVEHCLECNSLLGEVKGGVDFRVEQGGFVCHSCQVESYSEWGHDIWSSLKGVASTSYSDIDQWKQNRVALPVLEIIYRYLGFHHNLRLPALQLAP
jgi:recombinational DNA repair protein (RecF pathway)